MQIRPMSDATISCSYSAADYPEEGIYYDDVSSIIYMVKDMMVTTAFMCHPFNGLWNEADHSNAGLSEKLASLLINKGIIHEHELQE